MFKIDKKTKTMYCNRGDRATIKIKPKNDEMLNKGNKFKFSIVKKKDYNTVYFQKEYEVLEDCSEFFITLSEEDTRFYDVISKETIFWYEFEYNGNNTVIGYFEKDDDEGNPEYSPMEFILLPESPEKED